MSEAFQDIGPTAPPRWQVYTAARELQALAVRAVELSTAGPRCDVAEAERVLARARALLGPGGAQ